MKKKRIRALSMVIALSMLLGTTGCEDGADNHHHTFSKWEVTAEPSCAIYGMQKRICDDCGFTEFLQIPTLEHTAVVDEALAATCTLDGRTEGSHCSVCKQVIVEQQAIPATGHALVENAAVKETCTLDGKTKGSYCSICQLVIAEQTVIPATGHTLVENAAVKETCTLDGKTEGSYCSICQLVIAEQTVIPATGHTLVVDAAVEPTCTLPGRTEGSHCGICKLVIVEQRTVPAPGHDWADASDTASKTCRTCGVTEGTALEKPEEPTPAIAPLGVVREYTQLETTNGVEPWGTYWFQGNNHITADIPSAALAYSLTISDATRFASVPAGYNPEALLEWGKYPGLNMDILHKYGFTGKGAVIAYVDQPIAPHEQYAGENFHNTNNAKDSNNSMHGPAVLSLLAGKDIGTAPEAEVYFYGHSAWLCDQRTHAECLYQIIEQNKSLPEGQKITMVGFSDAVDEREDYAEEFSAAVRACEEAGIMVWFCQEYGPASFLPMSDKNDYRNIVADQWWGTANPQLVFIPASGRTTAATDFGAEYIYWSTGGLSWTMPYVLGLYAIAIEIDPSLTQDQLRELIVSSAYDYNGMRIVNPVGFVAAVLERVGRGAEGQVMLDEVSARQKYIYAIMDTAAMTQEDLQAVGSYLTTLTDATVMVVDAAAYASAEELYTALQADAAWRGGQVVGVQIFGNVNMVPTFKVTYKVQMQNAVDEGGEFFTDLFYGNFNNDPAQIANGYNVMDHFAEGWDVDLVSQWPVARLPLGKGEFSAFFEKYNQFVLDSGMERLDLVNFSNPIFKQTVHSDDMSYFLNRMNKEFGMLDIPYRLYASLVGEYPVTEKVLGGFTAENLSRENDAGIVEFIINTHGQWNNIDKCYYENGKEIRESLVNMDTINSVLDGNAYYLDCWTCLNGYGMLNNLTTTALNGNCVGMFSATTIISNNGVNCRASLEDMHSSNFYYFYYCYLKALHEGASRSRAFQLAQQAYTLALLADGADGISWNANYQFNLYNVLAYHNFGVLEPNAGARALTEGWGYIAQAGQSVPKEEIQGSGSMQNNLLLTDGTPVGSTVKINYSEENLLQTGTLEIHSFTYQKLDNGYIRFTMECTAREGMPFSVFNPPNSDIFMFIGGPTTGERQTIVYDISAEDVRSAGEITMKINFSDDDHAFIFINTVGIS